MTAKLLVREVGGRDFVQHNGDFLDVDDDRAEDLATAEGEKLCVLGNVEAFQVWTLHTAKQRVWKLEDAQ